MNAGRLPTGCYASPTMRTGASSILALAALITARAAAQQPVVVLDGNQQMVVPRADPKLPSDADLRKVSVDPELVRLSRALDAEHFADRDAAHEAILARKPAPEELMALLLREDLGDEARHQLVSVLRERILFAPRGALGIRMENVPDREGGVRITGLVPGMPAERIFKPGDVVRKIDESVVRNTSDLVNAVQSLPPGVEVKVVVRRVRREALVDVRPAGAADPQLFEEIEATLRLGSTDELNEKGDPALRPLPGGAVGRPGNGPNNGLGNNIVAGGFVTFERLATAKLAARRFLPKPAVVPFPDRANAPAEERAPVTVDSVRKLLMELQLSGGDPDLVRSQRLRLEQLSEVMSRINDPEALRRLQASLEALEVEIRGAF